MKINHVQIESGLNIYHVPTNSPLIHAQLFVPFGGDTLNYVDSKTDKLINLEPGSAHYFEHVLFIMPPLGNSGNAIKYRTNTPNTKKGIRDGLTELQNNGAVAVNAYTWHDVTNYWFATRKNKMENLATMLGFVFEPYLPKDRFKAEVGTILDEERRGQDRAGGVQFKKWCEQVYQTHGARMPIIGTSENIKNISLPDVLSLHDTFYVPSNMSLVVVGNGNLDEISKLAQTTLDNLNKGHYVAPPKETPNDESPLASIVDNFSNPIKRGDVVRPDILSGWKYVLDPSSMDVSEILDRHLSAKLATQVLFGSGSESREELVRNGLDDASFGGGSMSFRDHGMVYVSVETKDAQKTHDIFRDLGEDLIEEGFDSDRFEDARMALLVSDDSKRTIIDILGGELARYGVITRDPRNYFAAIKRLETITPKEVQKELEHILSPDGFSSVLMTPK